jgi:hypothetical protein
MSTRVGEVHLTVSKRLSKIDVRKMGKRDQDLAFSNAYGFWLFWLNATDIATRGSMRL